MDDKHTKYEIIKISDAVLQIQLTLQVGMVLIGIFLILTLVFVSSHSNQTTVMYRRDVRGHVKAIKDNKTLLQDASLSKMKVLVMERMSRLTNEAKLLVEKMNKAQSNLEQSVLIKQNKKINIILALRLKKLENKISLNFIELEQSHNELNTINRELKKEGNNGQ